MFPFLFFFFLGYPPKRPVNNDNQQQWSLLLWNLLHQMAQGSLQSGRSQGQSSTLHSEPWDTLLRQNVRSHAKEHRCQLMNRLPLAKTGTTERQKEWWMWSIETHQIYKIPEFTVTTRGGEAWREKEGQTETERQTQGTRLNWKLQNTNFYLFWNLAIKRKECLPL